MRTAYRIDRIWPPGWQLPYYEVYYLDHSLTHTVREVVSVHLFRWAAMRAWRDKTYGPKTQVERERVL